MLDTLFSIGSFQLKTLSVFQLLAFFIIGLVVWRRAKEENYLEPQVFDGFLLSFLVGWVVARVGHIIFSWDKFGIDILKWLNFVQYPGLQIFVGLCGATIYFFLFARKQKWDAFEILDWWAQAVSAGLVWINLGYFFAGTWFGNSTSLPWGVVFPGVFEKRHPIQIYFLIFHVVSYKILNWLEYHYRTFEWYRAGKKTAQTGFVFACFIFSYSIFSLLMRFLHGPIFMINGLLLDVPIHFFILILSLYIILNRSNRTFFSFAERKFFAIKK